MKKIIIAFFATGILLISCKNEEKKTEASTSKTETPTMDSATMMKNWMAYMTPGEPHALLAKANGEWETENTMWMSPDAPPTVSKGSCVNKMIMGGRYQVSENKGDFNGMPFEGISTVAYDNAKKVFVSSWIDNFGTGIMQMEGTYDSTTKTIHFAGNMIDPMTGKDCHMKENFTMIDDNNQMIEMFAPTPDGKGEYKNMNIKFTRKK
jgi:hypothetical protein